MAERTWEISGSSSFSLRSIVAYAWQPFSRTQLSAWKFPDSMTSGKKAVRKGGARDAEFEVWRVEL
jgi:hypothetical protein